jgi:hypothetical protein
MSTAQSTTILQKIRQRGYWLVVIRPGTFEEKRVSYNDLFSIIDRNSVRFRGWDYPHVDHGTQLLRGPDWIEQDYERDDTLEVWRFHTNGLFVHNFAMTGDWRDQSQFWPADPDWQPNRHVYYLDTIYSFVEIFEFGARLALSQAGGTSMRVEIAIKNLQGRQLISEGTHLRSFDDFKINADEWADRRDVSQTELISNPRIFAARAAQEFFARFGLNLSVETIGRLQEKIGR